jgi:phenylalanyl-tRNA synthetase beta chain
MTGQPVHAFDFDKLDGEEIKEVTIRYAFDGEEVIDLAGTKHVLDNCMLVVADKKKALDIAGVKGGMGSGVDENTKTVMMSAVNFEFTNIRNTSKKLKLRTDASTRFENDVPLCRIDDAINLFSRLLVELAEAEVSKDIIDTNPYEYEKKQSIEISEEKISRVLGTKVGEEKVLKIFNSLGFDTEKKDDVFLVKVPSDRLDLKIREDLIEEVGRVIGYDNLPAEMPEEGFNFPNKSNFKTNFYKTLDILVSEGFYEINSRALSKKGNIELANPYTSELSFVRSNLLGGLEDKVEKEIFNIEDLKVFEIGKVFTDYKTDEEGKIVAENWSFAGIIGKRKIKKKQEEELFFKTKGYLEKVFENIFAKNIV